MAEVANVRNDIAGDNIAAGKITVKTRDFDEIEISEKEIITFPQGLFAFEEEKKFILLTPLGEGKSPVWLQSTENPSLCFIMFSPFEFCPDYRVTVPDEDISFLEITDHKDAAFYVIAVIPENNMDSTVNMKSPVIINTANRLGGQVIAAENYPIKFPVFAKEGE
ncbi:MAG: flagellar assembly protein FliW [Oscillospiraceae bacterium]|nr:flagellar assembly protein FliW [Oscillospiraceae bacterium]